MNLHQLLLPVVLSLAVLPPAVLSQDPVQIQFQTDPVLVQTNTEVVFTVLTVSEVLSITWNHPGGGTLGLWAAGNSVVNSVAQYQGRVTITATQLRISGAQLRDAGNYTVEVDPSANTGLSSNSRSIQLRVFDAVAGVSLMVPSVAQETGNLSLTCTWTAGTEVSVRWGKDGLALTSDSRITIAQGSLLVNPARRGDAGDYTCTVSNPVSARTATQSLTVYYGPDTPQLTKSSPGDCVGGEDAVVGQTVRLTCVSDSLPPALFSWQHDGRPVASGQPDSGVLSVQTFSSNQSGRYICVARNGLTGGTSEQGTDLAVVGTCLSGGAVAGIVIGCLVALILIIIAIILLVRWRNMEQRLKDTVVMQNTNSDPRLVAPDPPPPGAHTLGRGQHPGPPLHNLNTHTPSPNQPSLFNLPNDPHGNMDSLTRTGPNNTNTLQHNGHAHTNGFPHNDTHQNANSYPHNGRHNTTAFTHTTTAPQNANTLSHMQTNPNILIQAGNPQAGTQAPTVHVNLNTLPHTAQQNNNAQLPTVHVNLNSYPTSGQANPQSQPLTSQQDMAVLQSANGASALQDTNRQNLIMTGQSYTSTRIRSGPSYPDNPPQTGHSNTDSGFQIHNGLIPTGYTHSSTAQRNANTQTYQRDQVPDNRSRRANPADASSVPRDATPSARSHLRQMPWDRLRGTPAYPNGTTRGPQEYPANSSYSTDYTSQPPTRQPRTPETQTQRRHPGSQDQTQQSPPRSRATPRQDAPVGRQTQTLQSTLGTNHHSLNGHSVTQPEGMSHTHISPHTQRQRAPQDIRAQSQPSAQSQAAPRQTASHSYNPQSPSRQQLPADHATAPQGPNSPQGPDTRALADPNHIQQVHNPSSLTQAALQMHTRSHNPLHSRNQQTQAALLNPGPQAQARRPPTPPPVIPLARFQTLPRERTQHSSPNRVGPPKPPVNVPMAQRQPDAHPHPHPNMHRQPATMHANMHHHPGNAHMHPGNTHRHANAHGHGHRHPAHPTQPHQQGHRGRPRH